MTEVTPLQQSTPKLGRLVVVGLGLIGGSFAKGLRSKGLFREVVGVDRDAESCRLAVELGVVDRCEEDLGRACVGATWSSWRCRSWRWSGCWLTWRSSTWARLY